MAAVIVGLALLAVRCNLGEARRLEDRTSNPVLPGSAIETVADLDYPPGNIAVSDTGRVFFSLHPDGDPPSSVHELVDGRPVPYPSEAAQADFQTVLAVRIDRQRRLWVLDHGHYGFGHPRITAYDLDSGREVHRYDFPSEVAGWFSMLNDFQVDLAGQHIYIAEASPIIQRPALIVYDVAARTSRRMLDRNPSVMPGPWMLTTPEREMVLLGLLPLKIGVDSIALDRSGTWLYYGPVNGDRMFRIATADLNDPMVTGAALGARVEDAGPKTLSDGLSTDDAGRVYITDPAQSAIVTLDSTGRLVTLVKDPRLRWPDGLSFGPDGWLYVTCSSLQHVIMRSAATRRANAPYQIYRVRPGATAAPGH